MTPASFPPIVTTKYSPDPNSPSIELPSVSVRSEPQPEDRTVQSVSIETIETVAVRTVTSWNLPLDFVSREVGAEEEIPLDDDVHQAPLPKAFTFSISYNGIQAPIAEDKMETLATQTRSHLTSIHEQIEIQVNAMRPFIDRGEGSPADKFKFAQLSDQLTALKNMTTFTFTKNGNNPQLELKYIDPTTHTNKKVTISLDKVDNALQFAIQDHIIEVNAEYRKLEEEMPAADTTEQTFWLTTPKGQKYLWLRENYGNLMIPANYNIEFEENFTMINFLGDDRGYYPRAINDKIVPHVGGCRIDLTHFYNGAYEIFGEALKDRQYRVESRYKGDLVAEEPAPASGVNLEQQDLLRRMMQERPAEQA